MYRKRNELFQKDERARYRNNKEENKEIVQKQTKKTKRRTFGEIFKKNVQLYCTSRAEELERKDRQREKKRKFQTKKEQKHKTKIGSKVHARTQTKNFFVLNLFLASCSSCVIRSPDF